ncbi:neutral/alkaline non-lysosomal ceramidase N-terminal domain-containing protein [Horticoccus sp. 23ND18S-11]|uniref:neutral/alkaline non-lysosomal ceramidase N-terminal domain-containing protein n=1 Tax=Horticoccus sp. 23ND18S-11 TaxID=3391832 RepID=UPI0039C93BD5
MKLLPRLRACVIVVGVWVSGIPVALAADAGWKAGFAAQKITPAEPLLLAGYASRTQPATDVVDDLHAKALALEDATGSRVILITADLIGFRADFTEPVCARITAATGVPRERILLNASHTHAGPSVMLSLRSHYTVSEAQAAQLIAYTKRLQDQCVDLATNALQRLQPARLAWGGGVVDFPMNRREFTERGVILGVNPRGPVDRSVPVLRIEGPDGKLRGVVFGAACHNTTYGSRDNQVSGDFAGAAQAYVEREFPGAQAMFMQGLAGDANPYPNSLNDPAKRPAAVIAREHGATLGREVGRVLGNALKPVNGPLRAALERVALPLQTPPARAELEQTTAKAGSIQKWVADQMLARLKAGETLPVSYAAPVTVWQFGQDLTLVGLPGEVVVDYVRLIEESVGPLKLWLTAYCNDTYGYFPSARVLREGGYETRGIYHGGIGYFAPEAEAVMVETVRDLAKRVGR